MKIAVLAGGISPERNVSLSSATLIKNALIKRGHRVALVDICTSIEPADSLFDTKESEPYKIGTESPTPELLAKMKRDCGGEIGRGIVDICRMADVVFMALHGGIGENGQLQAILDSHGIHEYSGSGFVGSMLAMNKDLAKMLLRSAGIPTPDWTMLTGRENAVAETEEKIGYPCVIKPNTCGSSVGISLVHNREELERALDSAFSFEDSVMCERLISGRELTVGILGGEVLPAVEIIPRDGFYDYKNKYAAGGATELCPAPISDDVADMLGGITKQGFDALRLSGYARFDYIYSEAEGKAYCLEANTLPGMTPTSLLPQMAAAVGIEYGELCERICMLAKSKTRD